MPPTDAAIIADEPTTDEPTLLDGGNVADWLRGHGLVLPGVPVRVTELAGGVSGLVLSVTAGTDRWVLKQALPRLRVADEWAADPVRQHNEAVGLRLARDTDPAGVPAVVATDAGRGVLLLEHAPAGWVDWRDLLLAGDPRPGTGAWLGATVARWHATWAGRGSELDARFTRGLRCFRELRVDPFHRTVAARVPELAGDLAPLVAELLDVPAGRATFVHGDLSPKNVLLPPSDNDRARGWVLDFEVAHAGDPVFDVAFLACSLLLEPLRDPGPAAGAAAAWAGFAAAYAAGVPVPVDWPRVARHTGALLLARVYGLSPDRGLDESGRRRADAAGRALLLRAEPGGAGALWAGALAAATGSPSPTDPTDPTDSLNSTGEDRR